MAVAVTESDGRLVAREQLFCLGIRRMTTNLFVRIGFSLLLLAAHAGCGFNPQPETPGEELGSTGPDANSTETTTGASGVMENTGSATGAGGAGGAGGATGATGAGGAGGS